jgi:hypothetical protein
MLIYEWESALYKRGRPILFFSYIGPLGLQVVRQKWRKENMGISFSFKRRFFFFGENYVYMCFKSIFILKKH